VGGFETWLARHGETEWSAADRHTGRTDLPLTDRGHAQARALRAPLAGAVFDRVLCSPLLRARQTCEEAGLIGRAEIRDELREWDYGDYEGLTAAEIRAERRPGWLLWSDGCPGGETPEEVAARVDPLVAELREGGAVVIFAHGHVLRVLTARWLEQPPLIGQRLPLATGTLSRLGIEHGYPVIRAWNLAP
jgi:probable phosphoglycerate mutase